MGRKQGKEDFSKAAEKFGFSSFIKDLQYDPETLCFSFEANGKSTSFTLYMSDEYPVLIVCADGTTLYPADGEPKYYNESLSYILDDICTEYCQKFGVVDGHKKTEPDNTDRKETKAKHSKFEDDLDEDSTDEEDFEMSPQLREEIVLMRKLYGIDCITERTFGALDLLNLDLHVSYPFATSVASAWGVRAEAPITIRMQLCPSMYLNSLEAPKIDILQGSQPCGLSTQLSFIVKNFCSAHWPKFANTSLTTKKLKTSGSGIPMPDHRYIHV